MEFKKAFYIVAFILFPATFYAQEHIGKSSFSLGLHYALLGEGDYEGWMITNHFSYHLLPALEISPSFGYLTSYRQVDNIMITTYLANHLLGDISIYVIPVRSKKLFFKIGGGASFRIRKEVRSNGVYYDFFGTIEKVNVKESSFDTGYTIQTILGTNISQRCSLSARLSLQNYNKGTQVVTFGLIGTYKI